MRLILLVVFACVFWIESTAQTDLERDEKELELFRKDIVDYSSGDESRKVYLLTSMEREVVSSKRNLAEMRIALGAERVALNESMMEMKAERDRDIRSTYKKQIKMEVKRIKVAQKEMETVEKRYGRQSALHAKAKSDSQSDEFADLCREFALTMDAHINQMRRLETE